MKRNLRKATLAALIGLSLPLAAMADVPSATTGVFDVGKYTLVSTDAPNAKSITAGDVSTALAFHGAETEHVAYTIRDLTPDSVQIVVAANGAIDEASTMFAIAGTESTGYQVAKASQLSPGPTSAALDTTTSAVAVDQLVSSLPTAPYDIPS